MLLTETGLQKKFQLIKTIVEIENEIWLAKVEDLLADLMRPTENDNSFQDFSTPILDTVDMELLAKEQHYNIENIRNVGGFWELEDNNETIEELLMQLTP